MRTAILALLLVGCSQPPTVSGIDPGEGLPGVEVAVIGQRFGEQATLSLEAEGASVPIALSARTVATLTGSVPEDVPAGTYDVVIRDGGHEVRVPGGFIVKAEEVDQPCGHLYTANTKVSNITKEVVVDRFYKDGRRETLRVDLSDIQRLEVERIAMEDGKLCSVVYMRKTDGERFRFADDAKTDLKARAYKLAQEIGKAVEVTREDPPPAAGAATDAGEAAGG